MPWKSDLRWGENSELTDRVITASADDAVAHFRRLLARDELIGRPVAARLVSPITRSAIYFSRFDRDIGDGRIHPDAPLETRRDSDGTDEATRWTPDPARRDWEADERPFADCLTDWRKSRQWSRDELAAELRTPPATLKGWLDGRPCPAEGALRRLMTLIG